MPNSASFFHARFAIALAVALLTSVAFAETTSSDSVTSPPASSSEPWTPPGVTECEELPTGELSDAELERLIPEGSPGRVRVRWDTESQENNYGFNIYRADGPDQPFRKVNKSIIPGEGSTNIPKSYCYADTSVERGKEYFYYIEEISTEGTKTKLEETLGPEGKGTRVKVRTVPEEREWLRKRALGQNTSPAAAATTASK